MGNCCGPRNEGEMTKLAGEAKITLATADVIEEGKTAESTANTEAGTGQNPEDAVKVPGETVCIWKQKAKLFRYRDN